MLTKTARVEIIAALATHMVQYTRYPTPYEYQTVCKKLIQAYPNIQDPVGNGYVSIAVPIISLNVFFVFFVIGVVVVLVMYLHNMLRT